MFPRRRTFDSRPDVRVKVAVSLSVDNQDALRRLASRWRFLTVVTAGSAQAAYPGDRTRRIAIDARKLKVPLFVTAPNRVEVALTAGTAPDPIVV